MHTVKTYKFHLYHACMCLVQCCSRSIYSACVLECVTQAYVYIHIQCHVYTLILIESPCDAWHLIEYASIRQCHWCDVTVTLWYWVTSCSVMVEIIYLLCESIDNYTSCTCSSLTPCTHAQSFHSFICAKLSNRTESQDYFEDVWIHNSCIPVSYTHLTLPTIYSV